MVITPRLIAMCIKYINFVSLLQTNNNNNNMIHSLMEFNVFISRKNITTWIILTILIMDDT